MKGFLIYAALILPAMFVGCASERNKSVLDSGGTVAASATTSSNDGLLTVYSAYDAGAHFYSRNFDGREYSDYSIFDAKGQLLRRVHNSTDTMTEEPATVSLPPGEYKVVARANGYFRNVTVPITIQRGRQTIIHLEGGGTASELAGADPGQTVRLPDGRIVGFQSAP
jgi:hypothetical protein